MEENKKWALQFVVDRGRIYLAKNKYYTLKVFCAKRSEAAILTEHLGGQHYAQGSGFMWALSRKVDLVNLASLLRPLRRPYDKLDLLFEMVDSDIKPPSQ